MIVVSCVGVGSRVGVGSSGGGVIAPLVMEAGISNRSGLDSAFSLSAWISRAPELITEKTVFAAPSLVYSTWRMLVVSEPNEKMKVTCVPSGTGLPLWSRIKPVRKGIISPTRYSGGGVGEGVIAVLGGSWRGKSSSNLICISGSGNSALFRSYPTPGIDTGEAPLGLSSRNNK